MGSPIQKESFDAGDHARFRERLTLEVEALRDLVGREGFGAADADLGAELELSIVDSDGAVVPINREVLARSLDPHLTLELDRFNLEYNLTPVPARGAPFSAFHRELRSATEALDHLAAAQGGEVITVGIVPTLTAGDLDPDSMTDLPRYRALARALKERRGGPFQIDIDGEEPLLTQGDDVTLEGAATSFQVHLRVEPKHFAATYNAAQLAAAPVLAACVNSPLFLGHLLWDETRIALFKQSVDSRPEASDRWRPPARVCFGNGWLREGALELFEETVALFPPLLPIVSREGPREQLARGETPGLDELRLHLSTVWRWNRPVYDPTGAGHLRIEMRALPSGPTPIDCAANSALVVGLAAGLAERMRRLLPAFPFEYAHWNFYRAARDGLGATLLWPSLGGSSPREVGVRVLLEELMPIAEEGLASLNVDPAEISGMLSVIEGRVAQGQTGAHWQRAALARMDRSMPRGEALREMTRHYMARSKHSDPVHTWKLP